ncbi:MAG: type III-B CRISPR-associated protein Cas10/Cmr2 [Pyramidobacter sp.]|jgi:CRISPR-associated protein Cmr2
MTDFLVQLNVGPVQGFIAAARRTRDLYMGSLMLSEVAKAVARQFAEEGGHLIFPCPEKKEQLNRGSSFPVTNVVLGVFKDAENEHIASLYERLQDAAKTRLKDFGEDLYCRYADRLDVKLWDWQLDDFLELYCAAVPCTGNYAKDHENLAWLMGARKNIRDFAPNCGKAKVPKSSLDGLRESVFREEPDSEQISAFMERGIRIKQGEALDAIGLIKRAGEEVSSFPPLSRVVIDPWVRSKKGKAFLAQHGDKIKSCCELLVEKGVISRTSSKIYEDFPYDGVALLQNRYPSLVDKETDSAGDVQSALKELKHLMQEAPAMGEPYLAILSADGDRMGKTISSLKTADEHRAFSRCLSNFAIEAREVVERYNGVAVYTGGDDVMAFLPLDRALACARELHGIFEKHMAAASAVEQKPTLSVGIAVAHMLEDLSDLLSFARRAEGLAKKGMAQDGSDDRNGLAVTAQTRGNIPISVREQWDCTLLGDSFLARMPLDERLNWWADRFAADKITAKFPYELAERVPFYENWNENADSLATAVKVEALRILDRKEHPLSREDKGMIREYINEKLKTSVDLRRLSEEMRIAQALAAGRC